MRAIKWRNRLIGDIELINRLRKSKLSPSHNEIKVIDDDIVRTFPQCKWFYKHYDEITKILLCYADQNPNMGYAQGMCFIVFPLYYVYYTDCPEHATMDTFFSLHTLMHHLRPCLLYTSPSPRDRG